MSTIRALLLAISAISTLFFGLLFATAVINPGYVEQVAKDLIRRQVEKKVHEKVEAIDARFLSTKAAGLIKNYEEEAARARQQLRERLPERLAAVIAEMQNLDCECRKKVERKIRSGLQGQIANATQMQEHLTELIRNQYMDTSEKLIREFRIFTGSNGAVFLLLGIATLAKRQAGLHLVPPAAALIGASAITSYLYLFNQNWLQTIVFNDYVGLAFVAYLAAVFAWLCDIVFNRARITARMLQSVSTSFEVLPC